MTETQPARRRWGWLAAGLILAALVAVLLVWWRPIYGFVADQDRVRAWVAEFGPWGPAAIVGLEVAQALLGPIPARPSRRRAATSLAPGWVPCMP